MVEDPHDGGVVAGGLGDGEGLVGQRLATLEGAPVGELRTQGGEHERPVGVVGGEPIEGHLQDLDLVGVDGAAGREDAPVVGQGGGHEALGVTEVGGPASGVEERVAKGGVSGLALGGAEPDGQVDAQDRIGVVGLGVEVEGLGVVAEGVAGGEGGERGVGRLAGVVEGLGQVDGLGGTEPVAGQLTDPGPGTVAAEVLQRLGHLPVRPRPTGGTEVLVQRVLDEGVGEAVVPRGVGELAHQGRGRRGVEDVEQLVFRCLGGPGQHIEVEVPADHRGQRQHPLGVVSQSPDPCADHHPDAVGQRHLFEGVRCDPPAGGVLVDRPRLGEVTEHLGHEERVAVGLAIHRMGETHGRVIEGVPGGGFHERHDAGVVEPGQLDAGDAVLSMQRRQRLEQRMRA